MTRSLRSSFLTGLPSTLRKSATVWVALTLGAPAFVVAQTAAPPSGYVVNDAHLHLTNYVQQGADIHDFLKTAKYMLATTGTTEGVADPIGRHADRFLFGTDEVAPTEQAKYLKVYDMYAPLFAKLTPEASEKVRKGNYERLFDAARAKVRAWERANPK
jgi:hypothetical protein